MKALILALVMITCAGCTMAALRRETLTQVNSSVDLRLREVMDNLALIADDPNALPYYASIFSGTSQIVDTGSFGETSIWARAKGMDGFSSQAANPQASRQIGQNWTLDPIVDPEQLEVVRYACRFAIAGPGAIDPAGYSLLARPDQVPCTPGRHFGVLDRLSRIPPGWLCKGCSGDVPRKAAYKACHGKTSVWVMPENLRALADFSLVIQDISRVNINSPTLFNPGLNPSPWTFWTNDTEMVAITVAVDKDGRLAPDTPYYRYRLDSQGSDTTLRSQIIAAGATK